MPVAHAAESWVFRCSGEVLARESHLAGWGRGGGGLAFGVVTKECRPRRRKQLASEVQGPGWTGTMEMAAGREEGQARELMPLAGCVPLPKVPAL